VVGAGIEVDAEAMFAAATRTIPDRADLIAGVAGRVYHHLHELDRQTALAGDPEALVTLLRIGGKSYRGLRAGVSRLNNAAEAVYGTAKDLRESDQEVAGVFEAAAGHVDVPGRLGSLSKPGARG
jgi:hypothetical protein